MTYDKQFRDRFWSKVSRPKKGCWHWKLSVGKSGYGQFGYRRLFGTRKFAAHQVAWELTEGEIPPGMCVLHECDDRKCCRPSHLFLGTKGDNNRDAVAKGRNAKHEKHGSAKITLAIARRIRKRAAKGETQLKIASDVGVSQSLISLIVLGSIWKENNS